MKVEYVWPGKSWKLGGFIPQQASLADSWALTSMTSVGAEQIASTTASTQTTSPRTVESNRLAFQRENLPGFGSVCLLAVELFEARAVREACDIVGSSKRPYQGVNPKPLNRLVRLPDPLLDRQQYGFLALPGKDNIARGAKSRELDDNQPKALDRGERLLEAGVKDPVTGCDAATICSLTVVVKGLEGLEDCLCLQGYGMFRSGRED